MLKGTRSAILRKVQPVSIHGQISWDVYFNDPEQPEGAIEMARVGPEAVEGQRCGFVDQGHGEVEAGIEPVVVHVSSAQSHAAPRTPLDSPCTAGTIGVRKAVEKV